MHPIEKVVPLSSKTTSGRLVGLDSLRGLAICMVIAFHVQLNFGAPGLVGQLALLGYNGVQLFFVVSGITMCYMWAARKDERQETTKFLIRRLCRIAPPFWFAIAFYMVWRQTGLSSLAPAGPGDVLLTALLIHGFSPHAINLVVPGGWSIAAEAGFYVLFPLLVTRLKTASTRLCAALAIYVACTICAFVMKQRFEVGDTFLYYSLLAQLPIFVVAMALFHLLFSSAKPPLGPIAAVMAVWAALAVGGRYAGWPTRAGMWAEVAGMLLLAAVVLQRYELRPLAFLGRISYSAYLFHFAIIDILALWLPHSGGLAIFGLGLVGTALGTIVVAWLSSRTLEAWAIALGRLLVARLDAAIRDKAAA